MPNVISKGGFPLLRGFTAPVNRASPEPKVLQVFLEFP